MVARLLEVLRAAVVAAEQQDQTLVVHLPAQLAHVRDRPGEKDHGRHILANAPGQLRQLDLLAVTQDRRASRGGLGVFLRARGLERAHERLGERDRTVAILVRQGDHLLAGEPLRREAGEYLALPRRREPGAEDRVVA